MYIKTSISVESNEFGSQSILSFHSAQNKYQSEALVLLPHSQKLTETGAL